MKKKLPHGHRSQPVVTPSKAEPVFGTPDTRSDLLNKYGTYNIQPTADSDTLFPLISHALPTQWQDMEFTKEDAEELTP